MARGRVDLDLPLALYARGFEPFVEASDTSKEASHGELIHPRPRPAGARSSATAMHVGHRRCWLVISCGSRMLCQFG